METTTENLDGAEVLRLRGKLDSTSASDFDVALRALGKEKTIRCVVLEMSGVSTLTSAPLRNILTLSKRLKQVRLPLFLAAPSENCREALHISGFSQLKLFEIKDSVEAILPLLPGLAPVVQSPAISSPTKPSEAPAPPVAAPAPRQEPSVPAKPPATEAPSASPAVRVPLTNLAPPQTAVPQKAVVASPLAAPKKAIPSFLVPGPKPTAVAQPAQAATSPSAAPPTPAEAAPSPAPAPHAAPSPKAIRGTEDTVVSPAPVVSAAPANAVRSEAPVAKQENPPNRKADPGNVPPFPPSPIKNTATSPPPLASPQPASVPQPDRVVPPQQAAAPKIVSSLAAVDLPASKASTPKGGEASSNMPPSRGLIGEVLFALVYWLKKTAAGVAYAFTYWVKKFTGR